MKYQGSKIKLILAIFVVFCFFSKTDAQTYNILLVTVTDQNSDFITAVTIRLKNGKRIIKEFKNLESVSITFSKLELSKYILEIEARGFKFYSQGIDIKAERNEISVKLEIAEVIENVDVSRDAQEKATDPNEGAFTNFLTKDQLAALPESAEEIEKALRNQFGKNVIIRVDGFSGEMIPKSQIASIRVSSTSFDAELHQLGNAYIDVISKAGGGKWFGTVFLNFNDNHLNARNPFAPVRFPAQNRNFDAYFSGPIIKKNTSAMIQLVGLSSYQRETINALTLNGLRQDAIKSTKTSIGAGVRTSHNLADNKTLNVLYNSWAANSTNDGVSGFNLPERAFDTKSFNHQLQVSQSNYIGKRFMNEIRFQYNNEITKIIPVSNKVAIDVIDAFSDGSAGNSSDNYQQRLWFSDNLLFGVGKRHALKIGGLFEYETRKTLSSINQNGTFTFSTLEDFALGKPAIFTQSLGERNINLTQLQLGMFIQDDIRLHKSFLLNLGLRYEWQNNLKDFNNFSPRIGFSWSPSKTGKISFRGGVGIYYNWLETNNLTTVLSQDKRQPSETVIINPSYPNPLNSGVGQTLKQSFWQLAHDLKNPYNFLASFGMDTQLNKTISFRALYKYEKGIHQFRSRDINAPLNGIRPNPDFGKIVQIESSAFFAKNSLNIGLNGDLNKRLSYSLAYTLSKTVSDNNGIFGLPSDSYNLRLDRSAVDFDQRHRIYASAFWKIRKGVNLSTNFIANSPLPFSIMTGSDNNGDTIFNDRPLGFLRNSERGNWRKQFDMSVSWTIGLIKKNDKDSSFRMIIPEGDPGGGEEITISHKFSIKIYTTVNNVFNQTNFTNFVGVQTSPFFRQPTSANDPRTINFGLRFNF
jgi:hypothetical protein